MRVGRVVPVLLLGFVAAACTVQGQATPVPVVVLAEDDVRSATSAAVDAWVEGMGSDGWVDGDGPSALDEHLDSRLSYWDEVAAQPEQCQDYYLASQLTQVSDSSADDEGGVEFLGVWSDDVDDDPAEIMVTVRVSPTPFDGIALVRAAEAGQARCGTAYSLGPDYVVTDLTAGPPPAGVDDSVTTRRFTEVDETELVYTVTLLARGNTTILVEASTPSDRIRLQEQADALVIDLAQALTAL